MPPPEIYPTPGCRYLGCDHPACQERNRYYLNAYQFSLNAIRAIQEDDRRRRQNGRTQNAQNAPNGQQNQNQRQR